MNAFRLAVLNLVRRPIPSLIALLAISISVAVSGVLFRINSISQERFASLAKGGDALVGAKSGGIEMLLSALNGEGEFPGFLPYRLYETLKAETTVQFEDGAKSKPSYIKSIIPFVYFAKTEGGFRIAGTDESFFSRPRSEDSLQLESGKWSETFGEVVAGAQAAKRLGLRVGDRIEAHIWISGLKPLEQNVSLTVSGILHGSRTGHSAWDRMLFTTVQTAQQAIASTDLSRTSIWGPNVLNYFLVYLEPNGFTELANLINKRTVGEAVLVETQRDRLHELTGTGENLGLLVSVLILALGGLSVTSMLITRFEAMTLQLAVLRAIGYSKSVIACWLLWEGFLLGLSACILGILMDWLAFPFVRDLLAKALPPPDVVSSTVFESYPIWITAVTATTASVFVPLYRVYRQDVHFSLRT